MRKEGLELAKAERKGTKSSSTRSRNGEDGEVIGEGRAQTLWVRGTLFKTKMGEVNDLA